MSNFLLKVSKLLIQADGNSILLLAIVPSPQRRNRANFTLDSVFKFLFSGGKHFPEGLLYLSALLPISSLRDIIKHDSMASAHLKPKATRLTSLTDQRALFKGESSRVLPPPTESIMITRHTEVNESD